MKKINKAIKIAGAIVCAALLFFNVSLNGKSSSDNLDLSASELLTYRKKSSRHFVN